MMGTYMHKYCKILNLKLISSGFNSEIYKEDFIIFTSPFKSTPRTEKFYVRFDRNRVVIFTMAILTDILAGTYSVEDLAYIISQNTSSFGKDGITVSIKENSLVISSLVTIGIFTSIESLYNIVYDTMMKCHTVFNSIVSDLHWNKNI